MMRRLLPGESPPPAELEEYADVTRSYKAETSVAPLSWRDLVIGSNVTGIVKLFAMQAEVLDLRENSVKLRVTDSIFATKENMQLLAQKISSYLGYPFSVNWELGSVSEKATLSEQEKQKEKEARAKRLKLYTSDKLVAEVIKQFNGVVDETSLVEIK